MILLEREIGIANWLLNREVIGSRRAYRDDSYEIKSHRLAEVSAHTSLEAININEDRTFNNQTQVPIQPKAKVQTKKM
ncbi:MAG: hypothetical protein ACI90A_001767 [Shewanella sp.]